MKPIVLMRSSLAEQAEKEEAERHFQVIERRTLIPSNRLVICRYSALPYYKELEEDVKELGSQLINSYNQHLFVADMKNWYPILEEYTPMTWFTLAEVPYGSGPFVLKGATNSKKNQFFTHMFAKDKREAIEVFGRLSDDGFVGYQSIYIRQYARLRKLCAPITSNSPPVSEEYRFFVLDGRILCGGFYWSEYLDAIPEKEQIGINQVPLNFLQEVVDLVAPHIRFFVLDVARRFDDHWIVIELNDGQQSGLSSISLAELYAPLAAMLA